MQNEGGAILRPEAKTAAPHVSLILATMGRTQELRTFLGHLREQAFRDFELIVVDQNPDDRLVPVLGEWAGSFPILHLRSRPGLSRARNVGLSRARGAVVGFPDDDCWYPPTLLAELNRVWALHPTCGGVVSGIGWGGVPPRCRPGRCTRRAAWSVVASVCLFVHRDLVTALGGFDERLGLGSGTPWGAGEDVDLALRVLAAGRDLFYEPGVWVGHPEITSGRVARSSGRSRAYGRSTGRLLRQHRFSSWFHYFRVGRSLCAIAVALARCRRGQAAVGWQQLLGRIEGWRTPADSN